MDDVIAVRVRDKKGRSLFFVTWGRVFDRMVPTKVESLVRQYAPKFGIEGVRSVAVCDNLGEASTARYFFEALSSIARNKIPFGKRTYEPWRKRIAKRMISGDELYFCGFPKVMRNQSKDPAA